MFLQYPKCFHQCSNRGKSVILFNVMVLFIGSLFTNTSGTAEERWWFLTWSYFVQCFLPVGLGNWNASCSFPIGQVKNQSHTRTNTHFAMGSTMWMTVRWPLVIFYNPNWCISRQCVYHLNGDFFLRGMFQSCTRGSSSLRSLGSHSWYHICSGGSPYQVPVKPQWWRFRRGLELVHRFLR